VREEEFQSLTTDFLREKISNKRRENGERERGEGRGKETGRDRKVDENGRKVLKEETKKKRTL
jgi:hypothetical protein